MRSYVFGVASSAVGGTEVDLFEVEFFCLAILPTTRRAYLIMKESKDNFALFKKENNNYFQI